MYLVYERAPYKIYTDPKKADAAAIHRYLSQDSYWAQNVPVETVVKSLQNSLCFSLYAAEKQIGLARVITDKATFAYLCDVYIMEDFRGNGLSKWLLECVQNHPDLQHLRRFMLATKDVHGLYEQFGFKLSEAGRLMEIVNREVYL
ncbi:GNAT family N-acetyltransferase [Adhaeribacter sp. BT258]|uniref:GNAT family N-acetyltransferase n=1 Tax=Adhaeribacter terrigena TaxID=2793070 RepID=A0ABS1BWN0_9BACT|nr:GNAT family N-acetyltransferase [Adhaeribacter terrigena]MBK0401546.1 GNAT family N-acetyltransferase [Adhaeribacter terrigena]